MKKKVLFLTNYPSPYRVNFFDTLGKLTDLTVLYSDRKETKTHRSKDWFVEENGSFTSVQLSKRLLTVKSKDLCWDVRRWLKKPWDAIVVHGYATPTAMLAIAYMKRKKIPFYMEIDGGLIRQDSRASLWMKRKLIGSADGWFSSGRNTSDYLVHYGADREKILEFPFSSLWEKDLAEQVPSREEKLALRRELQMEEDFILLSIGQFIHRKGFDILLQAAARLPGSVGIYIVGGLPTEEYQTMHRELGLHNVHFSGFQKKDSLSRFYRAADLFVLPTREDIWGLVVGEAMAYGLPVITTDRCVAGLELVENEKNGLIVPTEDPEALACAIDQALKGDLHAMAEAALEAVRPYTIENMAKVHADAFK